MGHDTTKVLMGSTRSTFKVVTSKPGTILAGKIVRLKSDDTISIAAADGGVLGISLGGSLSDTTQTAICERGTYVPILLTSAFTPVIGAQVCIDDTTGLAKASGAGVTGMNATYQTAVISGIQEDGTSANVALIHMPGGL